MTIDLLPTLVKIAGAKLPAQQTGAVFSGNTTAFNTNLTPAFLAASRRENLEAVAFDRINGTQVARSPQAHCMQPISEVIDRITKR